MLKAYEGCLYFVLQDNINFIAGTVKLSYVKAVLLLTMALNQEQEY